MIIPRPVRTRWNSTVSSIEVALMIRPAVDTLTKTPRNKLEALFLSDSEWQVVQDL